MKFRPLNTRILLKPIAPPERTSGGIIIPDSARERAQLEQGLHATVEAMGPGMLMKSGARWPMPECKPGDVVIYNSRHAGQEIKLADENGVMQSHLIVRDEDIVAVVEKT